ncbi:hypothetical protein CEXT_583351 [Caerostris extrusa]|uniref:Uncharacterized protein n=1 Tax=Caerostris extrusa TaxID=172846 RepID=A0AAV4UYL3_CAEEX|nr:hypothetical protein CEXT_583351 [Caerostris extrusa]
MQVVLKSTGMAKSQLGHILQNIITTITNYTIVIIFGASTFSPNLCPTQHICLHYSLRGTVAVIRAIDQDKLHVSFLGFSFNPMPQLESGGGRDEMRSIGQDRLGLRNRASIHQRPL